jgi:hypothetical protein
MLSANVGMKSVSESAFGLESLATMSRALPADRLTAQRYSAPLKIVLPGLPKDVPLAVRQCLWLQHDGAPAHCEEAVLQWLDAT